MYYESIEKLFPEYSDLSQRLKSIIPEYLKIEIDLLGGEPCLVYADKWIFDIKEIKYKPDNRLFNHIITAIQKSVYPFEAERVLKHFVREPLNDTTLHKINGVLMQIQYLKKLEGIPTYKELLLHHLGIKQCFAIDKAKLEGHNSREKREWVESIIGEMYG